VVAAALAPHVSNLHLPGGHVARSRASALDRDDLHKLYD
jgi:hypothetical protein